MKKRKIIPMITATFMAASLLITNTAFADSLICDSNKVNHFKNSGDYSGNSGAIKTGFQYVKVEPSSSVYNQILGKLNQSGGVHCDTSAPIWAIRTPAGYYTAISKNSRPTEIDPTNPANWQGGKAPDAYMEYVKAQQEYVNHQMITTGIAPGALKAELSSLNDIDPSQGVSGKNIVGLEAFCKLICEECKCKDKDCKHTPPPEIISRQYFLDYPEYKHDRASRSDVAQKDMPMSWTMFDNSAKGTDGYPLNIQYSAEDAPSDGHIEKDVVITPFGEMMNKLRQGIGEYAKFKNPAPSVEATNAYQQELIQRAIEHKKRTDKTKTGITIPKDHAISKALAKGGIVRVQNIIRWNNIRHKNITFLSQSIIRITRVLIKLLSNIFNTKYCKIKLISIKDFLQMVLKHKNKPRTFIWLINFILKCMCNYLCINRCIFLDECTYFLYHKSGGGI